LKQAIIAALAALAAAGCATTTTDTSYAAQAKPAAAPAKVTCKEPPKELVVKDLEPGSGKQAVFRSAVWVQYTGWLYDGCAADLKGEKFDSSEGRRTPFGFVVGAGRVIKGWDEGVKGMKENAKRLLIIPPDKGYGERGAAGGKIPPNATLVFEVTLLGVPYEPPPAAAAPKAQ